MAIQWGLAANNGNFLQQLAAGMDRAQANETRQLQHQSLLQQLANAQEDRVFRQQQAERQQQNWRADHNLRVAQIARGEIPAGFERDPNDPRRLRPRAGGPQDPAYIQAVAQTKPTRVPFGVQNAEGEDLNAVQGLITINDELKRFGGLIEAGKLNLGPTANLLSQGRNLAGLSDENSRNYASFRATLERLRNESLRLNKGVQTEGDSQRAWNELVANINDPEVVKQRLQEIQRLNQRAADFKRNLIVQRREDNRLPALDINKLLNPNAQNAAGPGDALERARAAIKQGARPEEVRQRLIQNGIDPSGL